MSQRHSEYETIPGDLYCTPRLPVEQLLSVEIFDENIWEPASGLGHIAQVLDDHQYDVLCSDIRNGSEQDFFTFDKTDRDIITNPPYSGGLANKFVRHALALTKPFGGKVAMLMPMTWDAAKGRLDLFAPHTPFKAKWTLTDRIRWANLEQTSSPSTNHAWYVWDWARVQKPDTIKAGYPIAGYLP